MLTFLKRLAASVPTPATDKVTVFVEDATGEPSYKDDTGTVTSLKGAAGAAGQGVPTGGTAGQVLRKIDGTDYNTEWATPAAAANRYVNVALSDMTTDLTTGTAKAVWFAPEDGTLASVYIGVHDPSSSGVVRVDMNDSGGTVFTTRPAIDATEATSLTGTAAVLDGTVSFVRGDKFTFDIDDAGTDAKGLQVCIEYAPA
jgi:hypothetical protein